MWRCGDLIDLSSIIRIVEDVAPDETYNLTARSFSIFWQQPEPDHFSVPGNWRYS
jgi:GDP-D-mannose dehydratase